ncbi:unnamed protein product, partial [Rotaria sp. Silwood2]
MQKVLLSALNQSSLHQTE